MKRPLLLVFCASLLLKLATFWSVYTAEPSRILVPDSASYYKTAQALVRTGSFAVDPSTPETPQVLRTPGYPLLMALVYLLFGESLFAVGLAQILISSLTLLVTFEVGRQLFDARTGLLAALLLALDHASFLYSQLILSETLFTFLLALTVLAGVRLIRSGGELRWALLLGAGIALSAWVRPINYYLVLFVAPGMLFCAHALEWRRGRAVLALSITLPAVLLLGGWQLRNLARTGSSEYCHIKGVNLAQYRGADIVARRDGISFREAQQQIDDRLDIPESATDWERGDIYAEEGMALITGHPLLFVQGQIAGFAQMMLYAGETELLSFLASGRPLAGYGGDLFRLSPGEYVARWLGEHPHVFAFALFAWLHLLVIYLGCALSIAPVARRRGPDAFAHLFVVGILLYLIGLSSGPEAYVRFRVPLLPLLLPYAASGLLKAGGKAMAIWRSSSATPVEARASD